MGPSIELSETSKCSIPGGKNCKFNRPRIPLLFQRISLTALPPYDTSFSPEKLIVYLNQSVSVGISEHTQGNVHDK